ncbi:MAG: NTP transferase domain-containing protein [Euzebyaceae bacterium]|jgi:molybdopterin-guanine dinucleotide biosynthesis protein A|nr:NTP transferase domain-containing protein [Euzebyaceae bacterium]
MVAAAVVLAGGRSSRMGAPKAALEWHGSTLLRRTVGIVGRAVDGPVLVVRAPDQPLPPLDPGVRVLDDPREGLGPLQGIAVGLAAAAPDADVAFVCSTDLPFLHGAFVRRVLAAFVEGVDVVLPDARGHRQPLAAAYRTALAPRVERLLTEGRLRPAFLFDECRVVRLDDAALLADPVLAAVDPALDSVANVNEPADYERARARPAPQVTVQRFGTLAGDGHGGRRTLRAATLAGAAAAAELVLDRHVVAAVNGDRITRDGETPLAAGDTVSFLAADAGG